MSNATAILSDFARCDRSGWSVRMHLLQLPSGGVVVYSPTWLGRDRDTFAQIEQHGEPTHLVLPNHFHHMSVARFRERYPRARVVASPTAKPRLRAKGHDGVISHEEAASELGPDVELIAVDGSQSGELWLSCTKAKTHDNATATATLLVGDAFVNERGPFKGAKGIALGLLDCGPGLSISRTVSWLQRRDRRGWAESVLSTLRRTSPNRVCFCHGDALTGGATEVLDRLAVLTARRLM